MALAVVSFICLQIAGLVLNESRWLWNLCRLLFPRAWQSRLVPNQCSRKCNFIYWNAIEGLCFSFAHWLADWINTLFLKFCCSFWCQGNDYMDDFLASPVVANVFKLLNCQWQLDYRLYHLCLLTSDKLSVLRQVHNVIILAAIWILCSM